MAAAPARNPFAPDGKPLNAFTGFSEASGRPPCANIAMSKMIRMTTSLISATPSTIVEIRTSNQASTEISATMPRASQGQAILVPYWASLMFRK